MRMTLTKMKPAKLDENHFAISELHVRIGVYKS